MYVDVKAGPPRLVETATRRHEAGDLPVFFFILR